VRTRHRIPSISCRLSLLWVTAGAAGLLLLGGFALIRRRQWRHGRTVERLLGGYFPVAGAAALAAVAAATAWLAASQPEAGSPSSRL
jgi:hypothetical protein